MQQVEAQVDEDYLVIPVAGINPRLEIYLYDDEAGFFRGRDWRIWEKPDFREPAELLASFLSALGEAFRSGQRVE